METSPASSAACARMLGTCHGRGGGTNVSARHALAATLVALAAALLLALGAAQPAYAVDASGEWGQCTWKIADDTLTVEGAPGGALTGDKDSAPWKRSVNPSGFTKVVVGTADKPVKYKDAAVEKPVQYLFSTRADFEDGAPVDTIDLSYFDISNVTDMFKMFGDCFYLTSLTFPRSFDASQVTRMEGMFQNCYALTSLDLSGLNTSKVENMGSMFQNCYALTSLNLSGLDTSQLKDMNYMFFNCRALTSLDLSGLNTSKVELMNGMFEGCKALEFLNLSGFNTSQVTNMATMFSGCNALTSLDLSSFDTSQVTDMTSLFTGCKVLGRLDLSNFKTPEVTSMSNMFANCSALASLDVSGFDTSKVTSMSGMFSGCSGLTALDLSNFNTSEVKNMFSMFSGCTELIYPDLSSFDTSKVTSMESMFSGCKSLVALDLSSFSTEAVMGGENTDIKMFEGCAFVAIRLGEKFEVDSYYINLPNMNGKDIPMASGTTLKATNQWIDPQGNKYYYYGWLKPGAGNVGWHLAEPASGSYALFDWGAPGEAPTIVAAAEGKVTPPDVPDTLDSLLTPTWYKDKGFTEPEVNFKNETIASGSATSFYAKWSKAQPTAKQYVVEPATYDSWPNAAVVKPSNGLAGKATVTGYQDSEGNPLPGTEAPTKAGAYKVVFDCAEGSGYQAKTGLVAEYVISPRKLNGKETADIPSVVVGSTAETVRGAEIKLRSGNIVAKDAPLTVTATVTRPSSGTAGIHYDATVTDIVLKNENYDLAGVTLSDQAYEVSKKTPVKDDFTLTPPTSLVYDGNTHKASVAPSVEGVGAVTVYYRKDNATPSKDAPKNAGTYEVSIDVAEGATYAEASGLVVGSFTVKPLALSGVTATLSEVEAGTGTVTEDIQLTGGNILDGDTPLTATATVTHPSSDKGKGTYADAEVTNIVPKNTNYSAANLKLTGQTYQVLAKKTPTKDDFIIELPPQGSVYNGEPHAATISTATEGVGTRGEIRYTKQGETSATTTPPTDAGTYAVVFDVAESAAYAAATIDAGEFTIAPITLNEGETAELPAVTVGSTTDPVAVDNVRLSGGAILAADQPLTARAMVTYPTTDKAAALVQDATVTDVELTSTNYKVPEGYTLTNQSYEVSAKPVPTIADFTASAIEAEYDGKAHTVDVVRKTDGVGEAENVRYEKGGAAVMGDPVDAGTYTLKFDVKETDTHAAAQGLVLADAVKITPRMLDAATVAKLSPVGQDTFEDTLVNVKLTGGHIVDGEELEARASKVEYPSAGKPGSWSDATVTLASLVNAPNYALPGEGLTLANQSYEVNAVPPAYEVTKGDDGTWEPGSEEGLLFRADVEFSKFRGVTLDGELVDPSNYTAESGSTIVTLKPAYLSTLAPGQHTLRLVFEDGAAEATFTVAAAPEPEPEPKPDGPQPENPLAPTGPGGSSDGTGSSSGTGTGSGTGTALAPTGDPTAPVALAAAVLAALAAASLFASSRARR